MHKWYKAKALREIFYQGKTYRQDAEIKIRGEDVQILVNAGVVGAVEEIEIKKEYAIKDQPEVAMRKHGGRKAKGK